MIDRGHDLALATQADLLGVARSTLYRQPRPVPAADLAVMRRIDELHLDYPFAGSRMMRNMLVQRGRSHRPDPCPDANAPDGYRGQRRMRAPSVVEFNP